MSQKPPASPTLTEAWTIFFHLHPSFFSHQTRVHVMHKHAYTSPIDKNNHHNTIITVSITSWISSRSWSEFKFPLYILFVYLSTWMKIQAVSTICVQLIYLSELASCLSSFSLSLTHLAICSVAELGHFSLGVLMTWALMMESLWCYLIFSHLLFFQ